MKIILFSIIIFLFPLKSLSQIDLKTGNNIITGTDFYKQIDSYWWKSRDLIAMDLILAGNIPTFYKNFIPIVSSIETPEGKIINATYYVASIEFSDDSKNMDCARHKQICLRLTHPPSARTKTPPFYNIS